MRIPDLLQFWASLETNTISDLLLIFFFFMFTLKKKLTSARVLVGGGDFFNLNFFFCILRLRAGISYNF